MSRQQPFYNIKILEKLMAVFAVFFIPHFNSILILWFRRRLFHCGRTVYETYAKYYFSCDLSSKTSRLFVYSLSPVQCFTRHLILFLPRLNSLGNYISITMRRTFYRFLSHFIHFFSLVLSFYTKWVVPTRLPSICSRVRFKNNVVKRAYTK